MFITLFKQFLLPPGVFLGLMLFAFLIAFRWRRFAWFCMFLAFVGLWSLSTPAITYRLFSWLESPYLRVMQHEELQQAEAIVVLGAGRYPNAPEYGEDQVSPSALVRLRYGAKLARELELPLLVTGGSVFPYEEKSEAELAESVLVGEWGIQTAVWLEAQSRNTWENARFSAEWLSGKNIHTVILVTHGYHMRRAQYSFEKAGLYVLPMATGFQSNRLSGWWNDWLPNAGALFDSRQALHEYLGIVQYKLRQ